MKFRSTTILLFFIFSIQLYSQSEDLEYSFQTGVALSSGENLPFWLLSNRYGQLSNDHNQLFGKFSLKRDLQEDKRFDIAYGISMNGRLDNNSDFYFEEWYARVKYRFLRLDMGSVRKSFGVQDTELSSGGILWSGNARPLPEISLSTNHYVDVPYTQGFIQFDGGMSHGWFDDYPGIKDVWLHHKWLMIKIGGQSRVHLTGGLHHFAQWGGVSDKYGVLASNLPTFWKVFIGNGGNENSPVPEQINAAGNHLGSYNFRFDYSLENRDLGFYWESVFEDNSGRKLRNFPDGLYGFSIKNNRKSLISGILFEFLATDNQSGPVIIDSASNIPPTGGDNYFRHYIYSMGWSSHLMTIGTPFITSPIYNLQNDNNRVRAVHLGLNGEFKSMKYKILYSFSNNMGTFGQPLSPSLTKNSFLVSLFIKDVFYQHSNLIFDYGMDFGGFQANVFGILLSWEVKF
jgi:hypothetical protein